MEDVSHLSSRELIKRLGGCSALAKVLGVDPGVVGNWHRRGIPRDWREAVAELAAARGLSVGPKFLEPLQGKRPVAA